MSLFSLGEIKTVEKVMEKAAESSELPTLAKADLILLLNELKKLMEEMTAAEARADKIGKKGKELAKKYPQVKKFLDEV